MSFRAALQALSQDNRVEHTIDGQTFVLKVMDTAAMLAVGAASGAGDREATVALLRAGVEMEDGIEDDEILSLPPMVTKELCEKVRDINNLNEPDDSGN